MPGASHNNFQDDEKFLAADGRRGRQLQVLVDGTYYINRLFATVEFIAKTVVEVGYVGVVVSYTGEKGAGDQLGDGDQFGFSMSLSADGNTLAVGAIGEDSGAKGINCD